MGLWNRVLGFKKVVNKYYILLSPDISYLLPKSYFFIFFKKKLNKQYQFLFIKKKSCYFVALLAILLTIREPRGMIHLVDRYCEPFLIASYVFSIYY